MHRRRTSDRIKLRPGSTAVAPKVDDPRGFAIHSALTDVITVSFSYDSETHIMSVLVEGGGPAERLPPFGRTGDGELPEGQA